jgi:carbamoyl-phosphate synthase small subunit
MRGALVNDNPDPNHLLLLGGELPTLKGVNVVDFVTCDEPYLWNEPTDPAWYSFASEQASNGSGMHVVALDYGIKRNILRLLTARGCRVTVVPANLSTRDLLDLKPDGIFLSNGPGDPAAVSYAIQSTRELVGHIPIFGICLGHQILGLALGGETYKLKFGHRGVNQPVRNLLTGQVEITTHNHGFAVRAESLPKDVEVTHSI